MTFIGTVTVRDRECDNDTAEGIALETVREWRRLANTVGGRVMEARYLNQAPSPHAERDASALYASIAAALDGEKIVGPCGYAGVEVEGEIVSGTPLGWSEQWRCPRCGQDNVQSIEGEGM
jgi:hypothetical protein